jgi:hypothetical protein
MRIFKHFALIILFIVIVNGFIQLKTNSFLLSQTRPPCCNNSQCNNLPCDTQSSVKSEDYRGCTQDYSPITCKICMDLQRIDHACDHRILEEYCNENGERYYVCAPLSVSLSGPTHLNYGQTGTYTATLTGGTSSFTYQWYKRYDCDFFDSDGAGSGIDFYPCDQWFAFGSSTPSVQLTGDYNFSLKVKVTDSCPLTPRIVYSNVLSVTVGGGLAKSSINLPDKFKISAYPNPFNPSTNIEIDLKENSLVSIEIFNLQGQKIRTLCDGEYPGSGSFKFTWDAKNDQGNQISAGTYLCRVKVNETVRTLKLSFVK